MIKQLVGALFVAFAASKMFQIVKVLGYHTTVYNHWPGPCRIVDGVVDGSEDMQTLSDGTALITSRFFRFYDPASLTEGADGTVFMFDFNNPNANVTQVKIVGEKFNKQMFNPHGISLFEDNSGKVYVFIVSHPPTGDVVERFTYDRTSNTLHHLQTIRDNHFTILNDVVAVNDQQFYYTLYAYSAHPLMRKIEYWLALYWDDVGFYDGTKTHVIAKGFNRPNGINISKNKRYVYLSHIASREIIIFKRNEDNSLTPVKSFETYTLADNIDVDVETGDLWLGCHAAGYKSKDHLKDPQNPNLFSPSRVLMMKMNQDGSDVEDLREVWAENELLNGVSVAVRYKNAMLIGTVHTKMMYCQIKAF